MPGVRKTCNIASRWVISNSLTTESLTVIAGANCATPKVGVSSASVVAIAEIKARIEILMFWLLVFIRCNGLQACFRIVRR